jgi:uncharacterized lipoprotein
MLSGCAFTTDRVNIAYTPKVGVTPVKEASNIVIGLRLKDERQEKSNKVSSKKNAFGVETAPILANEEITLTFRRGLEQELRARGFKIGDDALVYVDANIIKFWNDFKIGFFAGDSVAELNMSILVRGVNGQVHYSKIITTEGVEPNIQLMTGDNAKIALDIALTNGINQLFEDSVFIQRLIESSR